MQYRVRLENGLAFETEASYFSPCVNNGVMFYRRVEVPPVAPQVAGFNGGAVPVNAFDPWGPAMRETPVALYNGVQSIELIEDDNVRSVETGIPL